MDYGKEIGDDGGYDICTIPKNESFDKGGISDGTITNINTNMEYIHEEIVNMKPSIHGIFEILQHEDQEPNGNKNDGSKDDCKSNGYYYVSNGIREAVDNCGFGFIRMEKCGLDIVAYVLKEYDSNETQENNRVFIIIHIQEDLLDKKNIPEIMGLIYPSGHPCFDIGPYLVNHMKNKKD